MRRHQVGRGSLRVSLAFVWPSLRLLAEHILGITTSRAPGLSCTAVCYRGDPGRVTHIEPKTLWNNLPSVVVG